MYTIAVCDDHMAVGIQLEEQIGKYCRQHCTEMMLHICMSGQELKKEMQERHYDLIFLDIDLVTESGVDVGRYIRDEMEEHMTEIVYISNHTQYAMDLFQIQPLDFLVKPVKEQELYRVMERFEKRMGVGNACFRYQGKRQIHSIPYQRILYFESFGKKVKIHLSDNTTEEFYAKLSEMAEGLEKYGFLMIHKSFCINYLHIDVYQNEKVIMDNGAVLNISKAHRIEMRRRILKLQAEEL